VSYRDALRLSGGNTHEKQKNFIFILVLGIFAVTLSANATEYHTGLDCQMGYDTSGNAYYSWNQALNRFTYNAEFYCPVDSDNTSTNMIDGGVSVIDNHCTENVICDLRAMSASSTSWNYSRKQTNNCSSSIQRLYFDAISRSSGKVYTYMRCAIPAMTGNAMSGIHTYYAWEY
jgi:hypothetical protein